MSRQAWVTLATNDSYALGALVLAHSLRRVNSAYPAVVLITPSVSENMRTRLRAVFAEVVTVDVLDSGDAAHLALLARPELGITFTKIHCWMLTQYDKCVFLDADTLVVQNSDELFEREELSAAPDVGWPDCFNSGVFVFRPSKATFDNILQFAKERGSFDGGDQGLLNSFFSTWARGDISNHLPFLYNVTSVAFYSYLPALKQFGDGVKIVHFIGNAKPWLQQFNWESRTVDAASHLQPSLQLWWDIFVDDVHSQLDEAMVEQQSFLTYDQQHTAHYSFEVDPESQFPWHRAHEQPPTPQYVEQCLAEFYDPWENYRGNIPPSDESRVEIQHRVELEHHVDWGSFNTPQPVGHQQDSYHEEHHDHSSEHRDHSNQHHQQEYHVHNQDENDHDHWKAWEGNHGGNKHVSNVDLEQICNERKENEETKSELVCNGDAHSHSGASETEYRPPEVRARHPYDNFYLLHRCVLDHLGRKRCSHEPHSPPPTPSTPLSPEPESREIVQEEEIEEKPQDAEESDSAGAREATTRKPAPTDKLNCQLKPSVEALLPTPDSEYEDAATLAQKIIASEMSVPSTPQVISATPPVLTTVPSLSKDDKQLSVEEPDVTTPPVSLAQIGILPKKGEGDISKPEDAPELVTELKKPIETKKSESEAKITETGVKLVEKAVKTPVETSEPIQVTEAVSVEPVKIPEKSDNTEIKVAEIVKASEQTPSSTVEASQHEPSVQTATDSKVVSLPASTKDATKPADATSAATTPFVQTSTLEHAAAPVKETPEQPPKKETEESKPEASEPRKKKMVKKVVKKQDSGDKAGSSEPPSPAPVPPPRKKEKKPAEKK